MAKVSDKVLDILINGLASYKAAGIVDPWVLDNGKIVEPLDVLKELKELRAHNHSRQRPQPEKQQTDTGKPKNKKTVRGQQPKGKGLAS